MVTRVIQLTEINFKRDERIILDQVNLQIKEGEHWVILGKNGSGKTTILELMNGYLFPSSGRVEVLGNVYGSVDVREVRKKIGYISQSLFEKLNLRDPVWEVVATGEFAFLRFYETIPEEVVEKARELLRRINLEHVQNQTLGTLSQGERKKVMLARALMTQPAVLIMDEPCSGLDLYEREKLLQDIHELADQKISLIYVTHHIEEIIPVFSHVALLNEGKIVAQGKKKEVLTPEHMYTAYQTHVSIDWHNERPWIKVL